MRRTERGAFTHEERKAAVWALLIAAIVAVLAMAIQQPSLGPWGVEQAAATIAAMSSAQTAAFRSS